MEMLRPDAIPDSVLELSFRTSRTRAILAFVLAAASVCVPIRFGLLWYIDLPWTTQLVFAPIGLAILAGFALWFALTWGMAQKLLGAFRSGWLMAVSPDGVYVNFRHGSPRRLPGSEPSVVLIPHREIASAGRLWDRFDVGAGEQLGLCDLEFRLHEADTDQLRDEIREEVGRRDSALWFFGPDVAVDVPEAGVIRLDWRGPKMIAALEQHVPIASREVLPQATPATTVRKPSEPQQLESV